MMKYPEKGSLALAGILSAGLCIAGLGLAGNAAADDSSGYYTATVEAEFADVVSDMEIAVVNRGLVVDYTGKVGEMLSRTAVDVGAETPYADAVYMQFCSALHTHASVAADPHNIAICPYVVFAYALKADPQNVIVGYRKPHGADDAASAEALAGVSQMLREIVDEVAGE